MTRSPHRSKSRRQVGTRQPVDHQESSPLTSAIRAMIDATHTLESIFAEAGGRVVFSITRSQDIPKLLEAERAGLPVKLAVDAMLRIVRAEAAGFPPVCCRCMRQIGDHWYSLVLHADVDEPKVSAPMALCTDCAPTADDARVAVTRMVAEMTTINVVHEDGGRA